MLVNLKELLEFAEKNNSAIGSFNYTTLETIEAILEAAEKLNYPVILSHAPVHNVYNDISIIAPIAIELAKKAKIPVCIHLDHAEDIDYIKTAIDLGFTSVMFDGSHLSYEKNIELTKKVVSYAKKRNVSVEAELGIMPSTGLEGSHRDFDNLETKDYYTNPERAEDFVKKTKVDCLAISFGTVHGEYHKTPNLNFDIIKKTRERLPNFPLVMHGGSGINKEDYIRVINLGIRKINYYTYMQLAGYNAVKELINQKTTNQYHDLVKSAKEAMYKDIYNTIEVFTNKE